MNISLGHFRLQNIFGAKLAFMAIYETLIPLQNNTKSTHIFTNNCNPFYLVNIDILNIPLFKTTIQQSKQTNPHSKN